MTPEMEKPIQLRHLTTFRLGGTPLRYLRPATEQQLLEALAECRRNDLHWRVLGGGSNLVVDEGHLPYGVIHIQTPGFDWMARTGRLGLRVGAGTPTAKLLAYCKRQGLGGLEFLAGLPGTVGGAIAANAGAWGKETCDAIARLWIVGPDGKKTELLRPDLEFSYRHMALHSAVITEAEFALVPRSPELIGPHMIRYAQARAERFPVGPPSAGCIFKNPPEQPAGKLLDLCGFKGYKCGGAEVSERHANFILNRRGATSADVVRLIDIMRKAVRRRFGIELELEVRRWPAKPQAA